MPSEVIVQKEWPFRATMPEMNKLRGTLAELIPQAKGSNSGKTVISLGQGDPSCFPCFKAPRVAEEALARSSTKSLFNGYADPVGVADARRALAQYLSNGLPSGSYKPNSNDVFLTAGCTQAIQLCLAVLGFKPSNILLPRPGFPLYQTLCSQYNTETRFYDLIPEKNWGIDLEQIRELADDRTAAMVIINPNNPCGSVFSYEHALKIAKTAKDLKIPIISDEVYERMVFGTAEFTPMATFSNWTPVITLGGLSKRWILPGWRLGWLVTSDPHGILKTGQFHEAVQRLLNIWSGPTSVVQAALPSVLYDTSEDFHERNLQTLETAANISYDRVHKIDALHLHAKPEGSMFIMVKINIAALKDIKDDLDFALHLAKEEAIVVLPGSIVGLKNYLRVLFAAPSSTLEEVWDRIESFCLRHGNSFP